ncbi:MAG: isoleucine--tRNA ligase [Kiloniellaceae bacterium]
MSVDYRSTVFLPRSDFPMRANLPASEPEILRRWQEMDLFRRLREAAKGREKFILHDGPPYANGHLHIGHALNKILKDVVNRSQQMLGKDANYVPGWDCHGLPIEWKVEEGYRKRGQDKDAVPVVAFRRECREFAEHWIEVQTEEFQRLGVVGDWKRPYTTMAFAAEAQIVREIGKFLLSGSLYRGAKPVLWSVVEKTALADAEVEYHDHTSTTIWVRFPVVSAANPRLEASNVVVWTTTPWTIPGNRAVAFDAGKPYAVLEVTEAGDRSRAEAGETIVAAKALVEQLVKDLRIAGHRVVADLKGAELAGTVCAHPLRGAAGAAGGYDFDAPLLPADFVTMDQGTGFVHIAPGHGSDDFELGQRHGLQMPHTVDADGRFTAEAPLFEGRTIYTSEGKEGDANAAVVAALESAGALLARGKLTHTYPHSWRSKAPLIFRNTPQWFISMEANELRQKALKAINETRFVPAAGRARLYAMIAARPDWCVSRQRVWGVPLPIFVDRKTGQPLRDPQVIERTARVFEAEGGDAWFTSDPQRFLGPDYRAEHYEQVTDIVEVWFDSGSTHSFVLEARSELAWPAALYLEGSDQHRGWFHTSLLESAGTRGRAPYEAVLTHGFVLDEKGRKMSKSLGNVVAPQDVMARQGADILRLWAVASDYEDDLRIGPEILRYQVDAYRRLRNTLRYLIGNLTDFDEPERLPEAEMPELERWVLHRLFELDRLVRERCESFDFHRLYQALHNFCAVDLSAFYFDVRKDSLYCDRPDSATRRACRSVLDRLFGCLTAWLAPILCFTAEEAWWARGGGREDSVHLRLFPEIPAAWEDAALAAKWARVREVRRVVTGALELERADKRIGSSLQAHPVVYIARPELLQAIDGIDIAETTITSDLTVSADPPPAGAFTLDEVPGVAAVVEFAQGQKCRRCWKVLPDVGRHDHAPDVCGRCADAVQHIVPSLIIG